MDDSERRSLEQELRDERARRRETETRLEGLTEKADTWRRRAEERTERIDRLLQAQQRRGASLRRWVKTIAGSSVETAAPEAIEEHEASPATGIDKSPWPTQKSVLVVSVVSDPGKLRALDSFDRVSLDVADADELDRADLVVVEPAALDGLDDSAGALLDEWAARAGRQPLLAWTGVEDRSNSSLAGLAPDVTITSDVKTADRLGIPVLPGCFDPSLHSPLVGRTPGQSLDVSNLPSSDQGLIEKAASGAAEDAVTGVAMRRWAYRNHAPWVRASQLLDLAGVSARGAAPPIAAVVVSKRPDVIPKTIDSLLGQTLPPVEVVVAVHGGELTKEIGRAAARSEVSLTLLSLDAGLSFGECLNIAASHTTAPLLAKIDDDDHYGPAYLEDSFHTLCYSRADIIGKGAHYTYIAGKDTTVLRRPGLEETFVDGSPNGATLVFRRHVWDAVGFPHRPRHVDTGFLRAARSLGAAVYVGSRWEFCYVRGAGGHTWDAEDEVFLAGSEPGWGGFEPGRVEVTDIESR